MGVQSSRCCRMFRERTMFFYSARFHTSRTCGRLCYGHLHPWVRYRGHPFFVSWLVSECSARLSPSRFPESSACNRRWYSAPSTDRHNVSQSHRDRDCTGLWTFSKTSESERKYKPLVLCLRNLGTAETNNETLESTRMGEEFTFAYVPFFLSASELSW